METGSGTQLGDEALQAPFAGDNIQPAWVEGLVEMKAPTCLRGEEKAK